MAIDVTTTLRRALIQLQAEKARVDRQIAAIQSVLTSGSPQGRRKRGRPAGRKSARKGMSAATRRAVSRRMKAYWAKRRAAKK